MKIVVLTGAGISAESGVPTFRDSDGLWEGHRVEDVATPEAYDAQPSAVHRFYDARRAALAAVEPNPAHHALARLEEHLGDDLLVVTQNIDDLHERAGLKRVRHMHGELLSALCRG
jgi:NAD-dependent deacetylase